MGYYDHDSDVITDAVLVATYSDFSRDQIGSFTNINAIATAVGDLLNAITITIYHTLIQRIDL